MGHTHLNTIETSSPYDDNTVQYQDRADTVSTWMLIQTYTKKFSEGDKKWKLPNLARPQQSEIIKNIPPGIANALVHG